MSKYFVKTVFYKKNPLNYWTKGCNWSLEGLLLTGPTPLSLTLVVSLKAARTILERFRSKSYDFYTQFIHVSKHPGTLSIKQK